MVFNLKKSYVDPFSQTALDVPVGVNPIAAQYLWEAIYGNDPNMNSIADMVAQIGGAYEVQMEYERMSNPDVVNELPDDAEKIDSAREQVSEVLNIQGKGKNKMTKPFNLKKAQEVPFDSMGLNDTPEMIGDQLEMQQDTESYKKFKTHAELNDALLKVSENRNAFQIAWNEIQGENPQEPDSAQSALKSYFQDFNVKGEEQRLADAKVIYNLVYGNEEPVAIRAPFKEIGDSALASSEIIKKIAQNTANKNKEKAFNLTKTAQHKTMDNAILWGPGQTRIDPFLHQPVSDWHIVERNKGFGLVVDDIWNIDYETIWRENIMDKYSRPYKDKEGNWVGGYIQKRFEVDKNIPETNNMQLKPGQIRRPILPEYGNTESRLQAARAA